MPVADKPKKILILAGAGASAHAGYPLGRALSCSIWRAIPRGLRTRLGLPASLRNDFELLHDVLRSLRDAGRAGARTALGALRRALIQALGRPPTSSPAGPDWHLLWPSILHALVEADCAVAVFTTNYDLLFEYIADAWSSYPGLCRQARPDTRGTEARATDGTFPVDPFATAELAEAFDNGRGVPVVYLHGCAAWESTQEDGGAIALKVTNGWASPAEERAAVLWPGRGKLPGSSPFSRAYRALAHAAADAHRIVVVGSSIRDPALWASVVVAATNRPTHDWDMVRIDTADAVTPPSPFPLVFSYRRAFGDSPLASYPPDFAVGCPWGFEPELAWAAERLLRADGPCAGALARQNWAGAVTNLRAQQARQSGQRPGPPATGLANGPLPKPWARGANDGDFHSHLRAEAAAPPGFLPLCNAPLRPPFDLAVKVQVLRGEWAGLAWRGRDAGQGTLSRAAVLYLPGEGIRAVPLQDDGSPDLGAADLWRGGAWLLDDVGATLALHLCVEEDGDAGLIATTPAGFVLGMRPLDPPLSVTAGAGVVPGLLAPGTAHDCFFTAIRLTRRA